MSLSVEIERVCYYLNNGIFLDVLFCVCRAYGLDKVLYLLRRNVAVQVKPLIKIGLYKSLILLVLLYGFTCINPSRSELKNLERFQKKAVKWITGTKGVNYISQLWLLNILPLLMLLQVNNLLLLAKVMHESLHCIELSDLTSANGRTKEVFRLQKTRMEKTRSEYTFRNCRLAKRNVLNSVDLMDSRRD